MFSLLHYSGKKVLVTGGLGFIGSNLAVRLAELGATVSVIDNLEPSCGANRLNLASVSDGVTVIESDLSGAAHYQRVLPEQQVIFNLAGEVSHPRSMSDPERDLRINTLSQLRFLRACAEHNPGVRIVHAGTRQIYGTPIQLPVDEAHPARPLDFNGVHKLAAEQYHTIMDRLRLLDCVVLRLSNVYGPRMALGLEGQGFLLTYLNRLVRGQGLEVFGDGSQLRDPVHVNDVVDAFLRAGFLQTERRKVYNIAGPEALTLREIAVISARAAGGQPIFFREFPADRKPIDIGSFHADLRRARQALGWFPQIRFETGIAGTLAFYSVQAGNYASLAPVSMAAKVVGGLKSCDAA